jgi:hypothetical protein
MKPKRTGRAAPGSRKPSGVVPVRPVSREHRAVGPAEAGDAEPESSESGAGSPGQAGQTVGRAASRVGRAASQVGFAASRIGRVLRSRKLHFGVAGLLFTAVLALGAWRAYQYLYHSPHFGLRHVELSPTYHVDRETILSMAGLEHGQNLFRISPGAVRRRLLRHPWIRSVTVSRTLPDTLHIEIVEHESVAAILFTGGEAPCQGENCPPDGNQFYLVNADGGMFKRATPDELRGRVIITGVSRDLYRTNPRGVARLVERSLAFLELYARVPGRPELSEVHHAHDVLVLFLKHFPCAIHLESSDLPRRLEYLDHLLARMDLPLEKVRVIYLDDRENPSRVVVIPEEAEEEPDGADKSDKSDKSDKDRP